MPDTDTATEAADAQADDAQADQQDVTEEGAVCELCEREFKNQHGLDIHTARMHDVKSDDEGEKVEPKASKPKAKAASKGKSTELTASGISVRDNQLIIENGDRTTVVNFARPSLLLDLHHDSQRAALAYMESELQ